MSRTATRLGVLHVEVIGSGPPAVLWHSLFVDSGQWDRVRDRLAEHRTLVLVDGPGHGPSGSPPALFGLDDCADAAVRVIADLDLGPVDWLGTAWGGHVGIVLAARRPDLLRSLTVLAAPLAPFRGWPRLRAAALVAAYRVTGPAGPLVDAVVDALLTPDVRRADPAAVEAVRGPFARADRVGMVRVLRSAMLRRPDLHPVIATIPTPTLLLVGDDDPLCPPPLVHAAARAMPDATCAVISGSRHLPPLENPAATLDHILAFWAEHDHQERP